MGHPRWLSVLSFGNAAARYPLTSHQPIGADSGASARPRAPLSNCAFHTTCASQPPATPPRACYTAPPLQAAWALEEKEEAEKEAEAVGEELREKQVRAIGE